MYVAKLGGMYLEKIGLIGWTTNIGSVKFTSNRVKAMTFKSISDDHSLIIKQTKKMGAKFYEIEEHEIDIDKLNKA